DAGKCISYHTIESTELAPREIRERTGPWAFGCDICYEVCPWGRSAPDTSAVWGNSPSLLEGGLLRWLAEKERRPSWADATALRRPGVDGLARNAAIAMAANPSDRGRQALLEALGSHHSPVVRASAAWSLGHAHREDAGVRVALEASL